MSKKANKTEITPEILGPLKKSEKSKKKEDVIEVNSDEEFLVPEEPNESLLPKMVESLPVIKKSTDLKVQDPLAVYLKEISRHKLLTPEEERELTLELLRTGDIEVAKKLVLANLRLVVKIALEYKSATRNVMDLIQEGNIGLMKAVSSMILQKGRSFLTMRAGGFVLIF